MLSFLSVLVIVGALFVFAAERGEFIEEEEMDARLETMFKI